MATSAVRTKRLRRTISAADVRKQVGVTQQGDLAKDVRDMLVRGLEESRKDYESNALQDPFSDLYADSSGSSLDVERPPFNLHALAALQDRSNMLRQCIDAYVTNIEQTGWDLKYIGPEGEEDSTESQTEKVRIECLLNEPNGDYDLMELRERARRDKETIGAAAYEILRDPTGAVIAYYTMPAHSLRLTKRDKEPTDVTTIVMRGGKEVALRRKVYFRRIVQQSAGMKKVYFKEFGDPRTIDPNTGKENKALRQEAAANEIIYDPLYRSGYSYGVPRYVHVLPAILGSREAELVNLQYFQENAIPAMAVLIAGGSVSETSLEDLEDYFTNVRGRGAQNKILFIEAYGDEEAISDKDGRIAPPKIELKALQGERPQDALFQTYDDNNRKKTRSAMRLNPLFVGESEDMTHATADASLQMTEMQVFGPERGKVDTIFNSKILADQNGRPSKYWKMVSRAPKLTNPDVLATAMTGLEAGGAMSPNKVIQIANEIFGLSLKPIEEPWGDFPFAVTTAMLNKGADIKGFEKLGKMPPPPAPVVPGEGPPAKGGKAPPAKAKTKPTASGKPPKGGSGATDDKPRAKRERLPVEA